jgi:hypothetical protein
MTQQEKPIPRDESGLFDEYFKVRYPYLQSRSIDDLRKYGYRVSGVEELDRNLDKQEITTELTINQMFEKYRAGVSISVINSVVISCLSRFLSSSSTPETRYPYFLRSSIDLD